MSVNDLNKRQVVQSAYLMTAIALPLLFELPIICCRRNGVHSIILRNYMAQMAIDDAEKGDYNEVKRILALLQRPFDDWPSAAAADEAASDHKASGELCLASVSTWSSSSIHPSVHPSIHPSIHQSINQSINQSIIIIIVIIIIIIVMVCGKKMGLYCTMARKSYRYHYYRAMHYSAKCGIAIACCPSVRLSVCDVGGSGPRRLEILESNCS